MAEAAPGFREVWERVPWVTRYAGVAVIVLRFLAMYNPYVVVHLWNIPGKPWWQAHRLVTSALSTQSSGFSVVLAIFMFCSSLNDLEGNIYRDRARALYYLTFVAGVFYLLGPRFGFYCYLEGLTSAMTWTLSQEEPFGVINMIVVPVQRKYAPLVQLFMSLLAGSGFHGLLEALIGYFAAHLFLYTTELLPDSGGPQWLRVVPKVFTIPDLLEQRQRKRRVFGAGKKLGKEQQ